MSASNRTKIGGPTNWSWGVLICATDTTPSGNPTSWDWTIRNDTLEYVPTGNNDDWDWVGANCTILTTTTTTSTTSTTTSTTHTTNTTITTTTSTTHTTTTTSSPPTTTSPPIYTQTRYMRSDGELGLSQSTFMDYGSHSHVIDDMVLWGIKIFKKSGGIETEISAGTYKAQVYRSVNGSGIQSATWTPPLTDIYGCSIVVKVYGCMGSTSDWTLLGTAVFDTYALGGNYLLSNTWTVYYYTQRSYDGTTTTQYFYWGSASYNSRITGFQWEG